MLTYRFLQDYIWVTETILIATNLVMMLVEGGGSILFIVGKDERQRSLICDKIANKWFFPLILTAIFIAIAFPAFPGFQQEGVGNGFSFWSILIIPYILHSAASIILSRKCGSRRLNLVCQWVIAVCGWVIICTLGFKGASTFYTGFGRITPLNFVNVCYVASLAQTSALLYLYGVIEDHELSRRIRQAILVFGSLFLVTFALSFCLTLQSKGIEYDDNGNFYIVQLKYIENLIALPHILYVSISGMVMVIMSIILALFFRIKWASWLYAVGIVAMTSSMTQIAAFNHTAVFPCFDDPSRSLTLVNSCASQQTLTVIAIAATLLLPAAGYYLKKLWNRLDR